jgi:MFS family permease
VTSDAAPLPARIGPFAPLRHRAFRRIWIGGFVSNIGTWMETIALGIYVTTATGRAAWTGVVAAAGFLPGALFGPLGGALADRINRKRLLIATALLQTACASLMTVLVATNHAPPWAVATLVFVAGSLGAAGWPTYQAILPELVTREDLPGAVALGSAQYNLGRILGPLLAGVVIAAGGYSWALAINAVSFLATVIAIAPIAIPMPTVTEHHFLRSMTRGLHHIRQDDGLRQALTYMSLNSLLIAPFISLIPAVALKVFDNETAGTTTLVIAQGLGAVSMALVLGNWTNRFGYQRVMRFVVLPLPIAIIAYAWAPSLPVAALAIFIVGFLYLGAISTFMTTAQLRAPAALRGRVVAMFTVSLSLFFPIGSVIQGRLADAIGLRVTSTLGAIAMVAVTGVLIATQKGFVPGLRRPAAETPSA